MNRRRLVDYMVAVSTADPTLIGLGRELLACADRALLDAPLDALDDFAIDDDARDLLQGISESGAADCLRDLLATERLDSWIAQNATEREECALRAQFERWLGAGQGAGDDPGRLARTPPLPDDLEGVLAWARSHDLLGELTRPAAEVLADRSGTLDNRSLLECSLGIRGELARGTSLLAGDRVREQARGHLVRQARAQLALSARARLWQRMPPQESLRGLRDRLWAVVAGTGFDALHAVDFVAACPVTVEALHGTARGQLRARDEHTSISVRLFLSGHEHRALRGECQRCPRPGCLHVRVLAARLLDACLEPGDRLHPDLLELTRVPSWKRFVHALEAPTDNRAAAGSERVGFRLRLDGERVRVAVVVQKRLADGRWAPGTLASPRRLLRSLACSPFDRPVLEQLALAHRTARPQFLPADLGVLRSLHEHPFVQWEAGQDALQVVEESVRVELIEQPDGLLPRVTLGDTEVAAGLRSRDFDALIQADRSRAKLVFAPLTPSLRRLLGALEHFSGVLPEESYPSLGPWLASMQQVARVSVPRALCGTQRAAPQKLLLRITPGFDEGIDVALSAVPLPLGALWPPGQGPKLIYGLEDGAQVFAHRDLEQERARAAQLIDALGLGAFPRLEPFGYRIAEPQAALALLSDAARLGDRLDIEWAEQSDRRRVIGTLRPGDLQIRLFKKGHWLRVEGGATLAGAELAVGRLLEAARRNERFVPIAGQGYVEIERELFERLARAQLCIHESLREPSIASAAGAFWLATLDAETRPGDAETRAFIERARARDSADSACVRESPGDARLRDYQQAGVAWLVERSAWAPGVCLADEMGLGKTAQAIGLLRVRAGLGPALVVAPTSVVQNWCDELSAFAPELKVGLHRGPERALRAAELGPGEVLVTSYELLLRDIARFSGIGFATQVIDEAQLIKNARTQRAKAVRSIDALFRVALSGTPVENRLGDLWSLFQLLAPGLLGSWARFRARFGVPIERYEDQARAQALRALVSPFLLRRTKDQVARELPSRTELIHWIELSPAEQDLYASALQHARRAIGKRRDDEPARGVQLLAEITRLRQLACHPRLVLEDSRVESSKLCAMLQLLDDILPRGHRVLLFSQFTRHLGLVREALAERGVSQLYLDGSTAAAQRAGLVERFQAGEAQVFLISLKAGGTGLNLTAADYVLHMDPWWNPAAEDQASDRAHRLGQDRPLTIVKLVASGTIEEQVLGLHQHKRKLADSVLGGASAGAPLDAAALEALLDHRADMPCA